MGLSFMEPCERIFYIVIAGLDPAIHAASTLARVPALFDSVDVSMDHRVKPGGDERENLSSPRARGEVKKCAGSPRAKMRYWSAFS
jgi:hypothetical protein